jgi:hypothetical protein
MRDSDLRWKIEVWLLEFDAEVDAQFSAGESERGEAAYRNWLGKAFDRTSNPRNVRSENLTTTRAKFMRTCGSPAKAYLLKLRSDLQKSMRSNEFEPRSAALTAK